MVKLFPILSNLGHLSNLSNLSVSRPPGGQNPEKCYVSYVTSCFCYVRAYVGLCRAMSGFSVVPPAART